MLLLDEPTRGIDVGAKAEIYRLIRELSAQGIAILVASSEMPELLALSDRILVLREGRPTALLRHAEFGADTILDFASPGGQVQEPYRATVGRPARRTQRRHRPDAAKGELSMASMAETDPRQVRRPAGAAVRSACALRFILSTKLYWGLALLLLVGVLSSPVNSRGVNIFLSPGNLSNVLRQVSNNGMVAVGMTLVILTGGIDLSVGSILALGSVLCAMLLTMEGWTSAAVISIPRLRHRAAAHGGLGRAGDRCVADARLGRRRATGDDRCGRRRGGRPRWRSGGPRHGAGQVRRRRRAGGSAYGRTGHSARSTASSSPRADCSRSSSPWR